MVESGATQIMNRYYDRADLTNITGIVDSKEPANTQSFTYNDQERLSGAIGSGTYGTLGWTYDANGNRLTEAKNGVGYTYTYPGTSNRLTNIKQGTTTTRAFTYDAAGSTTQDLRGATAYNYTVNIQSVG